MEPTNTPLKVLFLTACTGRGGAGNSLYNICKYLDRSRFEPLVVMPSKGPIWEKLKALSIPVILPPRLREQFFELRFKRSTPLTAFLSLLWNFWDSVVFTFQLAGIVRRHEIDVIHSNHMMVKTIGVLAGALAKRPVVLHTRTIYANAAERFLYVSFAKMPHVRRIIAVSQASAANFQALEDRVEVVHNGVPLDEIASGMDPVSLRRELGIDGSPRVVGFIGRLVEWKGIGVFLDAAREILRKRNDVVFVMVGDVPVGSVHASLEDYQRQAEERGLRDRLLFTGFRADAAELVSGLDILVVPSIRPDPCPRVVLEGLARGTPVIGSATGGIPETIQDEVTGLLVESGNVAELVRQLERLLDDEELARRLSEKAAEVAQTDFSAEVVSQRVQEILLDAVAPAGTRVGAAAGV